MEVDDFVEKSSVLLEPLEDFFNNVFVMVVCFLVSWCCSVYFCFPVSSIYIYIYSFLQEDERIRKNRLALLRQIADLPKGIADLTLLPGF